jgi:hypothetical protein
VLLIAVFVVVLVGFFCWASWEAFYPMNAAVAEGYDRYRHHDY